MKTEEERRVKRARRRRGREGNRKWGREKRRQGEKEITTPQSVASVLSTSLKWVT